MYTLSPFHRHSPRSLMNPLSADRFFRSFFDMSDMVGSVGFRVDVRDAEDAFLLEADLPGVPKEQIQLTLDEDSLIISAEFSKEKKDEGTGYLYNERHSGHMERRFQLEGIQADHIQASYENGVLKVTLPKNQPVEAEKEIRKIEIQ